MSTTFICDVPRGIVYTARVSRYPKSIEDHEPELDRYLEDTLTDALIGWDGEGEYDYIGVPESTSQWEPCIFTNNPELITKGLERGGVQESMNTLWGMRRAAGKLDGYAPDERPDPWEIEWHKVDPNTVYIPDEYTATEDE